MQTIGSRHSFAHELGGAVRLLHAKINGHARILKRVDIKNRFTITESYAQLID